MDKCKVDGCDFDAKTKGFCEFHYKIFQNKGLFNKSSTKDDMDYVKRLPLKCVVHNCPRQVYKDGMCSVHYYKKRNRLLREQLNQSAENEFREEEKIMKCVVNGCDHEAYADNLCEQHYNDYISGNPIKGLTCCKMDNCTNKLYAKGLCRYHYMKEHYKEKNSNKEPEKISLYDQLVKQSDGFTCIIPNCKQKKQRCQEFCHDHYKRVKPFLNTKLLDQMLNNFLNEETDQ